jgi:hypothetical protein
MILLQRFIAVLILAIPGLLAAYGWSLMRDAVMSLLSSTNPATDYLKLLAGLALFLFGLIFLAGYYNRGKRKKRPLFRKRPKKLG